MEELQTDTLSDYGKSQNQESTELNENACAANLLNGCEELDDPLDLMDHCDNESIASNSDVWKGSDSEDDNFEGKENSSGNVEEKEKQTDAAEADSTEIPSKESDNNDTSKPAECDEKNETSTDDVSIIESEQNEREQDKASDDTIIDKDKVADDKNEEKTEESAPDTNNSSTEHESSVTNTLEKDLTNGEKEKVPELIAESTEKDSLLTESPEKDPLLTESTEKDPLLTESPEKDPLLAESTEKDPLLTESTEKDPLLTESTEKDVPPESVDKDCLPAEAPGAECTEKDPLLTEALCADPLLTEALNTESTGKDPLLTQALTAQTTGKDPLSVDGTNCDTNPNRGNEGEEDECEMDYEDDDFDPSLLCPEVSMAVDESSVVTSNGPIPNDRGGDSPLPYEPVFSTFVDEVTGAEASFNLTAEEVELRRRLYGPTNPIQLTRVHCTACNVHLGSALEGQNNRFVHPLLKVLICKECYHFYTSGEFEKDEDGSELYCRWCGQGGQVLCCSKCEYVFCKRCIRTNFGRKKMVEIQESDCWDCFKCNPSQIITQRIACFEFFEYVRREIARASILNSSEIWSKDHSRCCRAKRKAMENGEEVSAPKRPKKMKGEKDPDYNPLVDRPPVDPTTAVVPSTSSAPTIVMGPANKGVVLPKPIQIVPRYTLTKQKDNDIEFVRQIPAPHVTINAASKPGYRTILPSHIRPALQPPTLVRISSQPVPPLTPTNRILGSALQGRSVNTQSMMKHEWFEKTVRAAARVNSHLSYTLTQLNKAQSQAASVEELAVVHNKLQEILSSSINSLIQIRKNLRTEFIAGIKTVRLPSKKTETFNNDDDVIFVSAPSMMPMPSTSQVRPPVRDPLIIIDRSNKPATVNSDNIKTIVSTDRPKGYLKVKSVMELQNVPSECITIPDEIPPIDAAEVSPSVEVVCNGASNVGNTEKETDSSKAIVPDLTETPTVSTASNTDTAQSHEVPNSQDKTADSEIVKSTSTPEKKARETRNRRSKNNSLVFNVKEPPTLDVKGMMAVKVNVERVDLEELQKKLATRIE